MLTFTQYVEKAKETSNLKTDKQVAELIGITSASISGFCKVKNYPSQETVLKLANLAGISPEQALIDFNLWKTKDKPNAQKVWIKLSKMIGCLCLSIIFYCGESKANTLNTYIENAQNTRQVLSNSVNYAYKY